MNAACAHCATEIPAARAGSAYCCTGCEAVAQLLRDQNLGRYYDLAGAEVQPVGAAPAPRSHAWLEPLLAEAQSRAAGGVCALDLDVQGIHCAACVWLMNELFRRRAGAAGIVVNPALGKVRLCWRAPLDVPAWIDDVERFGYQLGPSRKRATDGSRALTLRLGVCAALAMNVMLFSVSFYFGLGRNEPEIYALFSRLSVVLSTAVVIVGGWPFFRSAAQALRARVLHLDLPIALGILLVYGTSMAQVFNGRGGDRTYFDTLNTFITLMVLGRFLQQRVIEKNRRFLLEDDGADGLWVRRIEDDRLVAVRAPVVRTGDRLLVAPGEVVPVDATLVDEAAAVSTDWITGESVPSAVARGGRVPAGGFNAGRSAFTVVAETDFADSALSALLRQTEVRAGAAHLRFWDRLARRWVATVLTLAAIGLLLWWHAGAGRALDVAVSLLVVTCPCAIGIALPLAYELTQARLRRAGFFARAADLLDRLERVATLVFDKTGTLTLNRLELVDDGTLAALAPEARDVAYALASRSGHPVSACVSRALAGAGARWIADAAVVESPGEGLSWRRADGEWRLGRAGWAAPQTAPVEGAVLSRDGAVIAVFRVREVLRPGARHALAELGRRGYGLWLISGDAPARAAQLAGELGIPAAHVRAARTPAQKAEDVAALDRQDTLYLGDGVNDSLAFERAFVAGTVAIDRPVMPGKADFFLVGEGLGPLSEALARARRLRQVVRRVLLLSVAYNVLAVSACLGGVMSPLRAAITMPASSLGILLFTITQLRDRRAARPAAAPALVTS